MDEKQLTMWDHEGQNALLHVDSIFCMGDKVVIKNSNPGTEGTIVGILDPRLFYTGAGGVPTQYIPGVIASWCGYNKIEKQELCSQRVYQIVFDTPKDNVMLNESVPEEVRAAQRVRLTAAPEADIMPAAQYWEEFASACEGEPSGEADDKTTPEAEEEI